jgi:hypothetical protein
MLSNRCHVIHSLKGRLELVWALNRTVRRESNLNKMIIQTQHTHTPPISHMIWSTFSLALSGDPITRWQINNLRIWNTTFW